MFTYSGVKEPPKTERKGKYSQLIWEIQQASLEVGGPSKAWQAASLQEAAAAAAAIRLFGRENSDGQSYFYARSVGDEIYVSRKSGPAPRRPRLNKEAA